MPNKKTNRLPRTNASSKMGAGRLREKTNPHKNRRSAETIQRLKMYTNGKAIRDRRGKVVAGALQMGDRAGDKAMDGSTGRIQPDRRWFGNTRVVDPTQLDKFRDEMTEKVADPYSVVLKRKKLPMGLLQDAAEYAATGAAKSALLEQDPFEHAFGNQKRRKRVKLDQLFMSREQPHERKAAKVTEDKSEPVQQKDNGYGALLATAQESLSVYESVNSAEGIVPWGRDSNVKRDSGEGVDWRHEKKDDLFLKGQSKRIWGEFFKVVDCSDVVLHVIDARNVPGTRCTMIENHISNKASHKHLVFILNKIDLVPKWVAKRWMGELAKSRPTIAFHASLTHAFGKGALISLLRQFGTLHQDKKEISVGVIGYPNVGKSSVINTLISKKSCKVAPIPGETKIWQYVSLFKRISLIDCPGVVVDTAGDSETDSVLKGVVRAERLENPEDYIDAILEKVQAAHIAAQYKLPKKSWESSLELMESISRKFGRLRKGGDPCIRSAAIMLINDFQRGRLPHYVPPPELKDDDDDEEEEEEKIDQAASSPDKNTITVEEQNLDELDQPKETKNDNVQGDGDMKAPEEQREEASDMSEPQKQAPKSSSSLIGDGNWDD